MKDNINEHDMTKKMMDIMRGGYKTKLITEADDNLQPNEFEGQPEQPEQRMAKPPVDGHQPIDTQMDDTYLELGKGDNRYTDLSKQIFDISKARVTSIYVSPNGDIVITGEAMKAGNSALYFTMTTSDKNIRTSSENIQGDGVNEIISKLGGFLENLREDSSEYQFNDKIDGGQQ